MTAMMEKLALERLELAPENLRQEPDPAALEALKASIREVGLLQGLVGYEQGGRVFVVAGGHRLRALKALAAEGHPVGEVPVRLVPREKALLLSLTENLARKDLDPLEEAEAPEAILLFTSNLMAEEAFHGGGLGENLRERLVQKGLRPEWVNRLDVVTAFQPFSGEALERLTVKVVRDYVEDWARRAGVKEARVDEGVVPLILRRVDTRFGARDLQRAVEELVADPLAEAYLKAGGKARRVEVLRRGDEVVVALE